LKTYSRLGFEQCPERAIEGEKVSTCGLRFTVVLLAALMLVGLVVVVVVERGRRGTPEHHMIGHSLANLPQRNENVIQSMLNVYW
jgi:hypothetical protein